MNWIKQLRWSGEMLTSAIDKLVSLGLSEYEARVYVVLIEESTSTDCRIADCSGVPRSKISEVLQSLENRGAVVSANGNGPRVYSAVPAEEFLDRIRRDYRDQIAMLQQNLGAFH